MLRSFVTARVLATLAVAATLAVPFAAAQERGEEIVGSITAVNGRDLVVKANDGREIRITVTPSTEVYFSDSGDRKLFPNPGIDDLRSGMGVRFVYNDGRPQRIVVHFVPEGYVRPTGPTAAPSTSDQVRARVRSVDLLGRQIRADVNGSLRTFQVEDRTAARDLRAGDLVTLTVVDRGQGPVVTHIESAAQLGTITRLGSGGRTVTIEVNGRDQTYDVDDSRLLNSVQEGDRVRFQVEDRSDGRRVVTAIQRRGLRTRNY